MEKYLQKKTPIQKDIDTRQITNLCSVPNTNRYADIQKHVFTQ